MAKRQFHCLDGVLRDLVAGMQDESDGWERVCELARIIGQVLDILEDTDDASLEDPEEPSERQLELDVGLRDRSHGSSVGGPDAGHAAGGSPHVVGQTRVEPTMVRRASQLAEAGARGTREPVVRTRERPRRMRS